MKKLSKWIALLQKHHKKELELKSKIEELEQGFNSLNLLLNEERNATNMWKGKADKYYRQLIDIHNHNDVLRFRIVKYPHIFDNLMNPYAYPIDRNYADEYFKQVTDDYKKKFVDELIKTNNIKEIDTDDYLEWQIRVIKE